MPAPSSCRWPSCSMSATCTCTRFPTAGNDLVLVGLLASVGLALGMSGRVRDPRPRRATTAALARVGWIAGALLIAGITSRHGVRVRRAPRCLARDQRASASLTTSVQRRGRVALVSMALFEVTARLAIVQLRAPPARLARPGNGSPPSLIYRPPRAR